MELGASLAGVGIGGGEPVRVVAVLNVSPESFHQPSVRTGAAAIRAQARRLADEGADLIDIGAMSTAPYLDTEVAEEEERRRLEEAVAAVVGAVSVPVSADTRRASVAAAALAAGARVINDTSGLRADPAMADVAAQAAGVILMACEEGPTDEPPLDLCARLLRASLERAASAGIPRERIVLDPGIGFFRRARVPWDEFDVAVLCGLQGLHALGRPLLIGVSRKTFIGKLTGRRETEARLSGSLAAAAIAVFNGADAVRAHDVAETVDACRVAERLRRGRGAG